MSTGPCRHEPLLRRRLAHSDLSHCDIGDICRYGTVVLHTPEPDALRPALLATGRWVEDPAPALRTRHKPWVLWSVRERRPGVRLHLEREHEVLRAHLDVLSPGRFWPLFPLHVAVDLWGWRTARPRLLQLLTDTSLNPRGRRWR